MKHLTLTLLLFCLAGGTFCSAAADTLPTDSTSQATDSIKSKDAKKKKKNKLEAIIEKQVSAQVGLLGVRHTDKDWFFEVPDSLLGRLFLSVTRFTDVPQGFKMNTGEEVQRNVVYFVKRDDKNLDLRAYAHSIQEDPESDISRLVEHASVDPILTTFSIETRNADSTGYLLPMSKFILSDNRLTGIISSDRTQVNLGAPQSGRTYIDTIQSYPINVEIQTIRTYASSDKSMAARTGFVTVRLNTSLVLLPEEPMMPRLADERVGYFQDKTLRFTDSDASKTDYIVQRYRLVPKDKKAYAAGKLTEPVKPIIYYIDPATPKKWVKYLKMGIEDWNEAFEAAGFKNAIQAREWPEDRPDMSPDDARFSVLRYLPSETENAYGPRIVDPRSGEILEAHICWYHNVLNLVRKWYVIQCGPLDSSVKSMHLDDELMGQLIRFVSSHEVGHTLGLRHNMIASSATPVEKLRDKAWVEQHGHTASIMDYARFNYVAQPEDHVGRRGLFPRINDYDKWAIKWGYQYRPEFKDPYAEQKQLRHETTQVLRGNVRLRYCSDEGKGNDPRSQAEDLGDDNVKASDYAILNLKRTLSHLEEWTKQDDGLTDDLMNLHKGCRAQFQRYCNHVQRNINGHYNNNVPDLPISQPIPKDRQKAAIDWMSRHIFTYPTWLYPTSIVNKIKVDAEAEMRERSTTAVMYLLSAGMLVNLSTDNLSNDSPYPVDEYLTDCFHAIWLPMGQNARQNLYTRRNEDIYVEVLGNIINPAKGATGNALQAQRSDIPLYLLQHLDEVEDYCRGQRDAAGASPLVHQHFSRLITQLEKIRNTANDTAAPEK